MVIKVRWYGDGSLRFEINIPPLSIDERICRVARATRHHQGMPKVLNSW